MENTVPEEIITLFEERKFAQLRSIVSEMNAADVVLIFEEIPSRDLPLLFRLLPKELAAETFVEMDPDMQLSLIEAFSDRELREVVDEMYVDDTVDIIEEMPANVVAKILRNTNSETRKVINEILKYPKDSAGSIMTTEYIDLKRHMTVADAFVRIRKMGVDSETIYTCYVTENRKLVGLVSVKKLLISDENSSIDDIMETNIIYVNTHDDKEDVARMFGKYDFLAIPVVDTEERLVGIVTFDDAMDVIEEENTEDIEKMASIAPTDKPYLKTGVFETWKTRIVWLLFLMISSTFTQMILNNYEDKLKAIAVLTSFIPMIMGTGGNSGNQSSVTVIRGLSLGDIELRDIFKVIGKEMRVALLCGTTLAAANFVKMLLVDCLLLGNSAITVSIAVTVSLTILMTVFMAKTIGCVLPMAAKIIGVDPAVMASPFISTISDALSLLIYFAVATHVLGI
ncbi:MAG: magnesium transporter [Oscillospiraceae bacterium]